MARSMRRHSSASPSSSFSAAFGTKRDSLRMKSLYPFLRYFLQCSFSKPLLTMVAQMPAVVVAGSSGVCS